jgi:hypothetical protein
VVGPSGQHSWPQARTSFHSSHARPHSHAEAKALQSWTPPTILCLYHTPTNQPHHLNCTSLDDTKAHSRYSRIVRFTRHQTMKYSSLIIRCAEANTDPNKASNHLPICASNRHTPARAHPVPLSSYLSRLDCASIHPVVHLSLPTPTNHPTT